MVANRASIVEQILEMLSPEERVMLVLRHTHRLGIAQIAHRLGSTRAAVARSLAQAETKVRRVQAAMIEALLETVAVRPPLAAGAVRPKAGVIVEPRPAARESAARKSAPVAQQGAKVGPGNGAVSV